MEKHDAYLQVHLERRLYEQETLNEDCHYQKPQTFFFENTVSLLKHKNWKSCFLSAIPSIHWLREYKWKESIIADIISGLTVAIMHIPQGMAYALLGNVPPVVGIYMAFFPVLIYFFFGTSRHVSMGTFAVVCLMTGKTVATYSVSHDEFANATSALSDLPKEYFYTPMQVATAVTLVVGMYQIVMYLFHLGIISTLFSEPLVNSFTTGAAVYVLISQFKDLLGLKIPKRKGYFKLIFTLVDIFSGIQNSNLAAVLISAITITALALNNECLKPWASKKCSMPIPIELIAVVSGTLISRYCYLPETYSIQDVGPIPTGLPAPTLPTFELLHLVAADSIAITMVSYTVTISMALIFAQKLNYQINSNQELLAMGLSNIVGSFFSCMPVSASLSRSLIQQTVGGRTQLASVVSCAILLTILLWIGPFFEPLPRCVLASIIVVALKGMFQQAKELKRFWKLSKSDALIWISTFLIVVIVNIDIGLLAGILISLAIILWHSLTPYICLLGHLPNTDLYLDTSRYKAATETPGMKIFHYCGVLNFANSSHFKSELYNTLEVNPQKVIDHRIKLREQGIYTDSEDKQILRCVIIDMSALSHIDSTGVTTLNSVMKEFQQIDVQFYLVNCTSPVFETIRKCDIYLHGTLTFKIFATIQDARTYLEKKLYSS
ncbi:solute carrier family 26 member 10-like isoform X2 [Ceratina calcarata]|uniref:Solute carrier family 26 member 10-like isoform X2 n=1 Tax=Ceratina calcarata TaxID=156304 RepID=A0AAJ7JC56_9HYME|nr:solute carrier family 26 member 10-like isoform X2 [Ceratina calcarata]